MWRCASRRLVPLLSNGARALPSSGASRQASEQSPWLASLADQTYPCFDRFFSAEASKTVTLGVVDEEVAEADEDLGIATGLERQELIAEKQGKKLFDLDPPRGPFGTKEHPAIIQSLYDERIVGCSGGVGEDEHDVVWFKLKKGENYECTICTQVFQLETVGPGGPPGGHHHH
eukprot:c18681_g1_i1 orf=377-898(-)